MKKIVFFDRDGTLSIDEGYTVRPEDMRIYPGAGKAVARIRRAGYSTVVVSNQSAVGRGMARPQDVDATNDECRRQLLAEDSDAEIDVLLYCPHHPDTNCDCRKPKTGLVRDSSFPWKIDLFASWMVGDKCSDLLFGRALGLQPDHCVLLATGEGVSERKKAAMEFGAELCFVDDLAQAADIIIGGE
jgi:histidinol-phosphate phosphatase family protein